MQVIAMFSKTAKQSGITLIELVVTIVILGVALVSLSGVMGGGASRNSDITVQIRATALAQAYLDEILGKRYDENTGNGGIPPCQATGTGPPPRQCTAEASFGVEGGESTRARLDDVDDYHGMDQGDGQTLPLQDAQGNTRTGYANFRVRVVVRYINVGAGGEEATLSVNNELDDEFDAKLVTVTVSDRSNTEGWDFSVYKSNF